MKIIKEFRDFIAKGNVIDLAIGIIIGGAFGKIVSSLVNDILMPPLGLLIGGVNFSDLKIVLKDAVVEGGKTLPAVTFNIGNFVQALIDFIIIAFALFMVIKAVNRMNKKKAEAPAPPPEPSKSEALLEEIRDLLKK